MGTRVEFNANYNVWNRILGLRIWSIILFINFWIRNPFQSQRSHRNETVSAIDFELNCLVAIASSTNESIYHHFIYLHMSGRSYLRTLEQVNRLLCCCCFVDWCPYSRTPQSHKFAISIVVIYQLSGSCNYQFSYRQTQKQYDEGSSTAPHIYLYKFRFRLLFLALCSPTEVSHSIYCFSLLLHRSIGLFRVRDSWAKSNL